MYGNINNFLKKKNYVIYFFILVLFFSIYSLIISQLKTQNNLKEQKLNAFLSSKEFSNIKEYIFDNLNSPYKEYNYIVENNDTIEKILKKYNIANEDINSIASSVVKKKLSNIFARTKVKIVIKVENNQNKIVSLFYPIDAITTVEIKRNKDKFIIKENILKLEKKEVVLSNTIKKKSLYLCC